MSDVRNVIIIGSGPAGYTAAVYAARANLAPLVFEGAVTAGGALMNTTDVENFPGFQDGIMGPDLMDNMRAQAERFGAELVTDDVTAVDLSGEIKTVTDGEGNVHRAKAVILSMGSAYRELGLPREKELSGHDPRNELLKNADGDVVALDDAGYVLVQGRSTRTNLPGVFASGDLVDHTYRQAITAAGSGCAAALDAEHYLAALEDTASAAEAAAEAAAIDETDSGAIPDPRVTVGADA